MTIWAGCEITASKSLSGNYQETISDSLSICYQKMLDTLGGSGKIEASAKGAQERKGATQMSEFNKTNLQALGDMVYNALSFAEWEELDSDKIEEFTDIEQLKSTLLVLADTIAALQKCHHEARRIINNA